MKISELIDGIKKRDIVLPEFQRQYVWSQKQAKKLMESLAKKEPYPVGGLLFWKTDQPPDLKNIREINLYLNILMSFKNCSQILSPLYIISPLGT